MSAIIEKAINRRTCRYCSNKIEAGEKHLSVYGGSSNKIIRDNICRYCIGKIFEKLNEEGE